MSTINLRSLLSYLTSKCIDVETALNTKHRMIEDYRPGTLGDVACRLLASNAKETSNDWNERVVYSTPDAWQRSAVCTNNIAMDISIKDFTDPLLHQFAVPLTRIITPNERVRIRAARLCSDARVFPRFKGSRAMRKRALEGGLRVVSTLLRNRFGSWSIPRLLRRFCAFPAAWNDVVTLLKLRLCRAGFL